MALLSSQSLTGKCPLCNAPKAQCSGHAHEGTPVDDPARMSRTEKTMAQEAPELREYRFNQYGNEVTAQLTAEHAERIGAVPADEAEATDQVGGAPNSKARKTPPANK